MAPPRTYRPSFGPVHNCPNCGHPIQYVKRRGPHQHREEADTGLTHYCKIEPPLGRIVICECNRYVFIQGDSRLDWETGDPHVCKPIPIATPPHLRGLVEL